MQIKENSKSPLFNRERCGFHTFPASEVYETVLHVLRTLFMFLWLFLLAATVVGKDIEILGRVVDLNGKPVVGATVYVERELELSEFDHLTFTVDTDEDGRFQLKRSGVQGQSYALYIRPPKQEQGYDLLPLIYGYSLTKLYPQMFKRPLRLGPKLKINIGTVKVDFPFPLVYVDYGSVFETSSLKLFNYWLKVYDSKGHIVASESFGTLDKVGNYNENEPIELRLPKGHWKLNICGDIDCKNILRRSNLFKVQGKVVYIKMSEIQNRINTGEDRVKRAI